MAEPAEFYSVQVSPALTGSSQADTEGLFPKREKL